jgi:hypothetical protein
VIPEYLRSRNTRYLSQPRKGSEENYHMIRVLPGELPHYQYQSSLSKNKNPYDTTMPDVKDKNSEPIKVGDHVYTPIRGGRHEGTVDKIVMSEEEAAEEGVKHPPKVRDVYFFGLKREVVI